MVKRIKPVTRTCRFEGEIRRLTSGRTTGRRETVGLTAGWILPLDVVETETEIIVVGEAPGLAAANLLISLHSSRLEIKGLKPESATPAEAKYLRLEREYGAFRRLLPLPAAVHPDKARATLENGVLTVILKKVKETRFKDRVVRIQRGAGSGGGKHG